MGIAGGGPLGAGGVMGKGNHYGQEARNRPIPTCPVCGALAREATTRYGLRNACCGLWSWDRHPLVSAETHAARNAAHKAFDALWRGKPLSRSRAYKLLAEEMNLSSEQCHMKFMDEETALRVPVAVAAIKQRHKEQ